MLLEFGAKNFFSFKEGFEVSLRLNSSCPKKISHNKSFANILAVKGANASGKTNVLKVLSFIQEFTLNSFSSNIKEDINFHTYFNNNDVANIYIIFLHNSIEYKYEVELTKQEIISEIIYKKDKRTTKIIERQNNNLIYISKEFDDLKIIKLKNKASLISTAIQYEMESISLIQGLFNNIRINVHSLGRYDELPDYQIASAFYYENKEVFEFVKNVLKRSDTGIKDVLILEEENKETGKIEYFPIFNYDVMAEESYLTFHEQSSGVKSLFQQLGIYKIALNEGGVLALDEFDINLHPDLLPMLVDFFDDEEKNKNNAQLIFTTHNSDIMDELGKYRVVLVNKEDNESFLYRLDEIPGDILDGNMLRNDRSISSVYNAGKIGGKPRISDG